MEMEGGGEGWREEERDGGRERRAGEKKGRNRGGGMKRVRQREKCLCGVKFGVDQRSKHGPTHTMSHCFMSFD